MEAELMEIQHQGYHFLFFSFIFPLFPPDGANMEAELTESARTQG
jgi:hypothetical protein